VFINSAEWVEKAAKRMQQKKVKPEMEVFEVGHVLQAADLVEKGLIEAPPYFQICLGIKWGAPADLPSLLSFVDRLPQGALWSVLATGANQLPLTTHAMLMGGNVRVGFEDNLYLSRGVKAKSNADFVERTVKLARILGREVATCAEAREILHLPAKQA
jgi:3-keto-5-aminohexanoate cleavage enzyme